MKDNALQFGQTACIFFKLKESFLIWLLYGPEIGQPVRNKGPEFDLIFPQLQRNQKVRKASTIRAFI